MNNKGFTLIELLATIVLLGVIAIISFVSINSVLNKSKVNDCEILVNNIKSAAKEYVSDNRYNLESDNGSEKIGGKQIIIGEKDDKEYKFISITAEDLMDYLSSELTNPFTKKDLVESDVKIVVVINDDYTAGDAFVGYQSISEEINCSNNKW